MSRQCVVLGCILNKAIIGKGGRERKGGREEA
jgi:hypothetical protein